jgi:hypothetical protein
VTLVRTDVSENISPSFSGCLRVIGFHSGVTVESLLVGLSIEEYCPLGCFHGSINDVFWDHNLQVCLSIVVYI